MNLLKIYSDYFHGKGYLAYKSEESQKSFLKGLINLAEKCFWAPMATLIALAIKPSAEVSGVLLLTTGLFILGMIMRHYALKEIDNINMRNSEKEKFNKFRRHRP